MLFVLPICRSPRVLPTVLPRQGSAVELLLEKKKFKQNYLLAGRHNLRSFLAENSTQNYFLIARMFSFCDICDKNAVFNILRQNVTNFDKENG